jgi:hypothetical protein
VIAERKALEASKDRERVELSLAAEAYERRNLRSPFDGVIPIDTMCHEDDLYDRNF